MLYREFIKDWFPLKDAMFRLAYGLLGSREDAEDVVQELYVKLWQSGLRTGEVGNPKAYCITIVRNMCLDRLKSPASRVGSLPENFDIETVTDGLEQRQKVRRVLEAMENLSVREKTVVRMKLLEDLSYKEIQERTGISSLSLRVLMSHARRKLKKYADNDEKIR